MNDKLIQNVGHWLKYLGAVLAWASDAWVNFPRKEKYFQHGKPDKKQTDSVGV